jgi:two-component system phosphate regulon sensor histidine kinase PhoR
LRSDAIPTSFQFVLALAAGSLMAVAAAGLPPVIAFGLGVAAALAAAMLLAPKGGDAAAASTMTVPSTAEPLPDGAIRSGEALIERLPSPVLIISRTGRVTFANRAAHEALPRLETGAHFASLIRAPAFVEAVNATLLDGREHAFEFSTHEGRDRTFEARTSLLPPDADVAGEAHAIVQIEDRTRARRAERMRSDFIANASHELRTPLASIIGYIETLQNHARDDPDARERFLAIMAREAGRMSRLVDDLMSLGRIEMSEHLRPDEELSLHAVAAESAAAMIPVAKSLGARIEMDLDPLGARVRGDRDQLAQVFTNLIDNALNYGGEAPVVTVRAADPGPADRGRFGVSVTDNGPGIPREHIHRLTERFYRVNQKGGRNKGGSGLGLAIAKHILNRHEGRLEISSKPGEGTAFTVWVPAAEPAPRPVPPHGPETVLARPVPKRASEREV